MKLANEGGGHFPHLGSLIKRKLKEKRMSNSEVARMLGITSQSMSGYLQGESLQFRILWDIGIAIEYNFLADLMAHLPPKVLESAQSEFQETILAQAEEIVDLKKEIEIYKGILKG